MVGNRDGEEAFLLAGNALYLARINFVIFRQSQPEELRKAYIEDDRKDFSSFRCLRDFLSVPGLIDDRIEPPFEDSGLFPWQDERLKQLLQSDADVAKLAFRDVPFSEIEWRLLEQANGGTMEWRDRAMPICRWMPGNVVWTARAVVLRYFKRLEGLAEASNHGANPSCLAATQNFYWKDVAARHPEWTNDPLKSPFVQEAVGLMVDDQLSAKAASEHVVDKHGHSPKGRKFIKGKVIGGTYENAVENLSRPASKIFKGLKEKGVIPNQS